MGWEQIGNKFRCRLVLFVLPCHFQNGQNGRIGAIIFTLSLFFDENKTLREVVLLLVSDFFSILIQR